MKHPYPLLLFLLLSGTAAAQRAATPLSPVDTMYFDHDWEPTEIPEDRVYARLTRRSPDGRPVGTVRDYFYPSWRKQFEGKLLREAPDEGTGLCTAWYENGRLHFRGTYVEGEPQGDYREWYEDGREVRFKYRWVEALPTSSAKLHSYYNTGSSRTVVPIRLPENTVGVVYKIDIRDEGQPPITWATAITLAAAYAAAPVTGGASALLMSGARALTAEAQQTPPQVSTKCRFFITDHASLTEPFVAPATKGTMPAEEHCYRRAVNVTNEAQHLGVPEGTDRLYICVQNDNSRTAAKVTVSVSALVRSRQ